MLETRETAVLNVHTVCNTRTPPLWQEPHSRCAQDVERRLLVFVLWDMSSSKAQERMEVVAGLPRLLRQSGDTCEHTHTHVPVRQRTKQQRLICPDEDWRQVVKIRQGAPFYDKSSLSHTGFVSSLGDGMRSCDIQEDLRVEALFLHIKKSQIR